MKIAAIKRATKFSPNHIQNDAQILKMAGDILRDFGVKVTYYDEDAIDKKHIKENIIFSMARSAKALEKLEKMENNGAVVLNSVEGVRNCFRENMMKILRENDILSPKSITVYTDEFASIAYLIDIFKSNKLWVKREGHIVHKEDIALVTSQGELQNILKEFKLRNIRKAVILDHLVGDEIKFYAVKGTGLVHWYYTNNEYDYGFREDEFKENVFRCSDVFGLNFFGGDAIIGPDHKVYFIDVNDWPSFAPIRELAAKHIAEDILASAHNYMQNYPVLITNKIKSWLKDKWVIKAH